MNNKVHLYAFKDGGSLCGGAIHRYGDLTGVKNKVICKRCQRSLRRLNSYKGKFREGEKEGKMKRVIGIGYPWFLHNGNGRFTKLLLMDKPNRLPDRKVVELDPKGTGAWEKYKVVLELVGRRVK